MRAVDRILEEQDQKRQRLEAARAATAALTSDEKAEFIAELIRQVEAADAPSTRRHRPTDGPTFRDLIVGVLSQGTPLGTSGVLAEVKKVIPTAEYPSVASEIQRMKKAGIIEVQGTTGRGAAYALSATSSEGAEAAE